MEELRKRLSKSEDDIRGLKAKFDGFDAAFRTQLDTSQDAMQAQMELMASMLQEYMISSMLSMDLGHLLPNAGRPTPLRVEQPQISVIKNGVCKVIGKMSELILGGARAEATIKQVIADQNTLENKEHNVFDEIPKPFPIEVQWNHLIECPIKPSIEQIEEKDEDNSIGKALHACELFGNEMGQLLLLRMRSLKADYYMFDEMPELTLLICRGV